MLELNARNVELLAPMDASRLGQLLTWSRRADVILCDGQFAGFVIVFGPGTDYDSENYRWFSTRFGGQFDYLDRVVLDAGFRRRGLASAVYDVVESAASERGRLALEVNLEPPNEPSLAFHRARGFVEFGQRGDPDHQVTLMVKDLRTPRPDGHAESVKRTRASRPGNG